MIAAIERAIIERLRWASEEGLLGFPLRQVASYGGQTLADLPTEVRQYPAAWVVWAGEDAPQDLGAGVWQHRPRFTLFVAARSARAEWAARLGGGLGEAGSYQVLEACRAVLVGRDLGLDIHPLTPGRVFSVQQDRELSVYAMELLTFYGEAEAPADPGALADFLRLHADWDLPPIGNVTPPLPATDADAIDDVFLPGAG